MKVDPASTTKSSPEPPLRVMVLVPEVGRSMVTVTLLVKIIWPQVIPALANIVAGPVAGVPPPRFVPSKTNTSVAPVDDGLELPPPLIAVFQFAPVFIPVAADKPPTQ